MPTRLYLRNEASGQPGAPAATATTDSDAGHVGAQRLVCMTMSKTNGAAQVERTWDAGVVPDAHCDLMALFISPALAAQTLVAGTRFTHAGAWRSGPLKGGSFIYLWRPGVGRIATLFGADSERLTNDWGPTAEWPAEESWFVGMADALGEDIEVQLRDRIVLEAWLNFAWENADEQSLQGLYWEGADESKEHGDLVSDAAAYLEYSGDLILGEDIVALDPDNILIGTRELLVDDGNVGALIGGTRLEIEEAEIEQQPDKQAAPERLDVTARRLSLVCQIEAATLQNLAIAWGLPPGSVTVGEDGTITLIAGNPGARPIHEVIARGKGPGTHSTRTIRIPRATIIKPTGHAYSKREATAYEVHFLALADPTKQDQMLMEVSDDGEVFEFQ